MIDSYVVVDLETTGFSANMNEIIQVAGLKVIKGRILSSYNALVKPVRYIPRSVTQLTGISNEDVEFAADVGEVLQEFYEWCGNSIFVGHNIKFDYRFLCRYGLEAMVDFSLKKSRRGIDTLELARKLLELKSNRLEDVAAACHVEITGHFHNALTDCHVTNEVYKWFRVHYSMEDLVIFPRYLDKQDEEYGKAVDNGTLELT